METKKNEINVEEKCGAIDAEHDEAWNQLLNNIRESARLRNMTDCDAYVVWILGLAAFTAAKNIHAKFPHDC